MDYQDKQKEILRGKEIKEEAELLWGWATAAGKIRAERRAGIIISGIKQRKFSKVLEIGSGTGVFTKFFCDAGLDVYGIDISEDLLKKTRIKCSQGIIPKLNVADVEKLPYPSDTFDAVVGVCVLHHINIKPALTEIKRVIKKDGIILFSEPNMMNPQLILQKNIKLIKRIHILGETEDEMAFFRWQIKKLLKQLGFKNISVTPFDFLHPWTPKPLIPLLKRIGFYFEKTHFLREIAGSLLIAATK